MKTQSNLRHQGRRASLASRLAVGLLLCTGLTPAAAIAQEAGADNSEQLQDIVVTAQRREQNMQDTPVAVSAFNAQTLLASGVTNVKELTHVDPSLNIPQVVGVYLPFLRGVGNAAGGNLGNESSVPVYIDDVYYTRLSTAYLAISSIDRVEVLKGPQGTLFGRNSSGGAIQMFTRDPGQKPEVSATIGYGNYNTLSGQFYAATPLTDTLSWNIAFGGSDQKDGWGKSITTGGDIYLEKHATVRSKLLWEPGTGTRVKLVGFYAYTKGDIGIPVDRHSGTYGGSAAVPLPGYPNPPVVLPSLADVPGNQFYNSRVNFLAIAREKGYGGSLRIDQDAGFADLVSITAFRRSKGLVQQDGDLTAQNLLNADLNHTDRQFTQEFQIKSQAGSKIDWIVGAFYLHTRVAYVPAVVYGDLLALAVAPGATQNIYSRQTIDSYSGFGQATAPIGEQTNVTLGLRYTSDKVSGFGRQTATIPGVGEIPLGPDFSDSKTFRKLTWKGALDHHFSDDVMAYASIGRGYKSGTYKTLPLDDVPALPETVDTYEVGLKTELFDRRVRVNGALFWNDIKNPQVLTVISRGLVSSIGLTNAQKARVKGAELGGEAIVASGLKLRGAVTYLDAKYREFTNAPFYSQNGQTIVGPVTGDASGNRLPNAAKWRFDVGLNYTIDTGLGKVASDVSVSHTGRFAWNPDNLVIEKAVTLLNASLNLTPSSLEWMTIGLWGKNLGNVKYYAASQENVSPLGTGGFQTVAAAPRTYGGSISVKF